MVTLILYSKPGCHLCEGLQEKLEAISDLTFQLEIRDIAQNSDWFQAYQYEVPVLKQLDHSTGLEHLIPRPAPRWSVAQLEKHLRKTLQFQPESSE